jgi:hypothetical protein
MSVTKMKPRSMLQTKSRNNAQVILPVAGIADKPSPGLLLMTRADVAVTTNQ